MTETGIAAAYPISADVLAVPLAAGLAVELHGLSVERGIDDDGYRAVREALDRHAVVLLRDQRVTPEDQRRFAQGIGTLRPLVYSQYSLPDCPEVMVVSNIKADGRHIGIPDAGMLWHSDGAYLSRPDMYSLLYGIEIPRRDGCSLGDTSFVSVWRAYEALSSELKARIAGRTCVNSFTWHLEKKARLGQLARAPLTAEQKAATPDVRMPVVRRHPNTGVPCLFVNEAHTTRIDGLDDADGTALLDALLAHLRSPRFMYRHRWRSGDLLIWDNCAVQHLAHFDYGDLPRRMHRTGTLGPEPQLYLEPTATAA